MAAQQNQEQVISADQEVGPYSPSANKCTCAPPIIHSDQHLNRKHPAHVQINSVGDHHSWLREHRPPTPAPRMHLPASPLPDDDDEDSMPQELVSPIGWHPQPKLLPIALREGTCPTCSTAKVQPPSDSHVNPTNRSSSPNCRD